MPSLPQIPIHVNSLAHVRSIPVVRSCQLVHLEDDEACCLHLVRLDLATVTFHLLCGTLYMNLILDQPFQCPIVPILIWIELSESPESAPSVSYF